MQQETSFQSDFFNYEIAVPHLTLYPKQYAKTNDLRLLIQIFTRSYLRMSTDSKTSNLHFTCKKKGFDCFDLEAAISEDGKAYYLIHDFKKLKHKNKCEQEGHLFKYLEIYNLMKLKKNLIQKFMRDSEIMNESPSVILTFLSEQKDVYFFEKYIGGQIELKRKLRKRFDNVVNIDIKKIGKIEQQEKEEQELIQPESKADDRREKSNKRKANFYANQMPSLHQFQSETSQRQNKSAIKFKKIVKKKHQKKQPKSRKSVPKPKNKQKQQIFYQEQFSDEMKQYILLLGEGQEPPKQQIINLSPSLSLAALNVLNETGVYNWDSSSDENENENDNENEVQEREPFDLLQINKEDYFKSLRNSTLKKSLQKQSLTLLIFSKENMFS